MKLLVVEGFSNLVGGGGDELRIFPSVLELGDRFVPAPCLRQQFSVFELETEICNLQA